MEILESSAPAKIVIKPDFLKPFETITPPNSQCCRRAMPPTSHGRCMVRHPFTSGLMRVFMNIDRMNGKDFETRISRSVSPT
jgi:hypothetical protein